MGIALHRKKQSASCSAGRDNIHMDIDLSKKSYKKSTLSATWGGTKECALLLILLSAGASSAPGNLILSDLASKR